MDNGGRNEPCRESDETKIMGKQSDSITYYTQVAVILVVVIASIINLRLNKEPQTLWVALLTSCVGYVLPNPRMGSDINNITMKESMMVTDGSTNVNTTSGLTP